MTRPGRHDWSTIGERRQFETRTECRRCPLIRITRAVPPAPGRKRRATTEYWLHGRRQFVVPMCN